MLAKLFWINGRNNRLQYWVIGLISGAIAIAIVLGDALSATGDSGSQQVADVIANLSSRVFLLAPLSWVQFINSIRRCHDRDKSGYWSILGLVPIAGAIWQFIELGLLPGTDGENRYGPPPGAPAHVGTVTEASGSSSGIEKVDDAYIEAYARRYAAQQRVQNAVSSVSLAETTSVGSFGKRR